MRVPAILAVMTWEDIAIRLGAATAIGLAFGFDREMRGHEAGLRTHALVALSSAMIVISALLLFEEYRGENAQPDPLRAIEGLAQAVGFIAAGLIFVSGDKVKNLTTAANIWLCAAVGIACGAGQVPLVVIGTLLGLTVLVVLRVLYRAVPDAQD